MKHLAALSQTSQLVGQPVIVKGWIHSVRDMGRVSFIDLRDHSGLLQVVVDGSFDAPKLGLEWVVEIAGEVRERGERFRNPKLATGKVELGASSITVLNESAELPFELKKDTIVVNEELRLKHRYLDMRSERMSANLRLRHKVTKYFRDFLDEAEFIEVETPMLTKGTPEGSREFMVPSRLHPEKFYVLPQSPQQFKQLLMIGGVGRYFQVARCMRDEDQRGDRQPEFTQVDMELSFTTAEEVMALNEALLIGLVEKHFPEHHITTKPFSRITYADAMVQYGSDKPDLRKDKSDDKELAFCWVTDFPLFEINEGAGKIDAVHHPFTAPQARDAGILESDTMRVRADAYDIVLNGFEVGGGSIRIHQADLQRRVFSLLGLSDESIEARFGHMLEAFKFGAPPHGGLAYGLDRLIMILAGEPNIREVIAFPKTGDARDPLTGAPSSSTTTALAEAHIKTVPPLK